MKIEQHIRAAGGWVAVPATWCVGRKLVLKPVMTGFYSYGEVSPFSHAAGCELHNQTMTVTTISER